MEVLTVRALLSGPLSLEGSRVLTGGGRVRVRGCSVTKRLRRATAPHPGPLPKGEGGACVRARSKCGKRSHGRAATNMCGVTSSAVAHILADDRLAEAIAPASLGQPSSAGVRHLL